MRLSSLQLQAFLAVARQGGFSKAAATIHVTQSALSQRIQNLEEELGVTLFLRERAGTRLTDAGELLLRHCRTQESLEGELLQRIGKKAGAKDALAGELRIGGFSTVMRSAILPALGELVAANPEVRIEAVNRELRDLPGLLRSGEIDYAVVDGPATREGVKTVLLGHEEYVLVEARKPSPGRADVYLDHDADDATTERFLREQGKPPGPLTRSFLDEIYSLLDGVALGWGRAVVPRHLCRDRADIRVVPGRKSMRTPVHLHFVELPFHPRLHEEVVGALTRKVPKLLRSAS